MSAGTANRTRVAKNWASISRHDLVEIKGHLYTVVKIKDAGKGRVKVTIRDPATEEEYTSKVDAKHGVDVVELVKRKRMSWKKPEGQAETDITEILGGKLVGVKPSAEEMWVVPLIDPSTIAGHLYIFHGISPVDVLKPGGYEEALDVHETEHAKPITDLHEPHIHEADRPVTQIGPRFR